VGENFYVIIFGQTGRTYSWQRDCKEGLKRKDEKILIDGQKKRKSTKKDKDNLKKQKK